MKNFKTYLAESTRQYVYKVKLAGDLPEDFMKKIEEELARFDVQSVTSPKKTPVMPDPVDFPDLRNEDVTSFEMTLMYPASQAVLTSMMKECGMCETRIKVLTKDFDDGWSDNESKIITEPEESPILEKEYPENTDANKESSEAYAGSYQKLVPKSTAEHDVAGGKTPPAKTTNDLDMGVKSPVGSQKQVKPEPKSFAN